MNEKHRRVLLLDLLLDQGRTSVDDLKAALANKLAESVGTFELLRDLDALNEQGHNVIVTFDVELRRGGK